MEFKIALSNFRVNAAWRESIVAADVVAWN